MVSHGGFRSQKRAWRRPGNFAEWHTVGPQPAHKTFEDIFIVLLGSIVRMSGCFRLSIMPFLSKAYLCLFDNDIRCLTGGVLRKI